MNKINARLDEAKRLLKSRPALTAMTPNTPALSVVTLAVLDEKSSQIHLLTIPKESFLKKGTEMNLITSLDTSVMSG